MFLKIKVSDRKTIYIGINIYMSEEQTILSILKCAVIFIANYLFFFFIYAIEPSTGLLAACTLHINSNNFAKFCTQLHWYTTKIHVYYLHTYN